METRYLCLVCVYLRKYSVKTSVSFYPFLWPSLLGNGAARGWKLANEAWWCRGGAVPIYCCPSKTLVSLGTCGALDSLGAAQEGRGG